MYNKVKLFLNQLQIINGIKFTLREVDVLTCIANNRSEKKIAAILKISYRTVGSHVRNIMNKIQCHSKAAIIEFIESSNQMHLIREYYDYLNLRSIFIEYISKIAKLIADKIIVNIQINNLSLHENTIINHIINDLKHANIIVNNIQSKNYNDCCYDLLIFKSEEINNNNNTKGLFLVLSNIHPLPKVDYVDFSKEEKYYQAIFNLIKKITNISEIENVILDFTSKANKLYNKQPIVMLQTSTLFDYKLKLLLVSLLTILIPGFVITYYVFSTHTQANINNIYDQSVYFETTIPDYISKPRNKEFIGRKEEMQNITAVLNNEIIAIISGPPGYGKTSLALEYSYLEKLNGTSVIWLNAESNTKAKREYVVKLAIPIGIQNLSDYDIIKALVNNKLRTYKRNVLLVFDNVENYSDIKEIIDDIPNNVRILITTRDDNLIEEKNHSIRLKAFTREEAIVFFKNAINKAIDDSYVESLLNKIGGETAFYPYQLKVIASYINDNKTDDIRTIIRGFNIRTLWDYIFDNIDKSNIEWDMLIYFAYLDPDFISIDLITKLLPTEEYKKLKLAIRRLEQLSLVQVFDNKPGISIHRLSQSSVRNYLKFHNGIQEKQLKYLVEVLNHISPHLTYYDANEYAEAEKLYKHLEQIINIANITLLPQEPLASIYSKLGEYNKLLTFNYALALNYKKQALQITKGICNDNCEGIASLLTDIGALNYTLGNVEQALLNHQEAVERYKNIHSSNNLGFAKAVYHLADAYHLVDRSKGLKYHKEALEMRQQIYKNRDSIDLANSLNDVGLMYKNLDNPEIALFYQKQALEMRKRLYGEHHPDIALSLNGIGLTYDIIGDVYASLKYLKQALEMRRRLYGEHHPDIAQSLNNVGRAHYDLGEYETALEYLTKALEIRQMLYTTDNPDVARSMNNLGLVYIALGQSKLGLDLLENGLVMRQKIYHDDNPSIAMSLYNIGNAYKNVSKSKSLDYLKKACNMINATLGKAHKDSTMICGTYNSVATGFSQSY